MTRAKSIGVALTRAEQDVQIVRRIARTPWVRCACSGCRRRVRSWYIEQEAPESDGWALVIARARADRWVCPIHALEVNDVVDRPPEVKRAFEVHAAMAASGKGSK